MFTVFLISLKIYYLLTLSESWFGLSKLIYSALLLALILFLACGNSPTEDKAISSGNWSGLYLDSIPVTFTVNGSSMNSTSITISYEFSNSADSTITWVFDTGISENTFLYENINGSTPYTFALIFQGTFTPPDQVHGTILTYALFDSAGVHLTDSLDGSWSATSE